MQGTASKTIDTEESKRLDLLRKAKIPEEVWPLVHGLYRTQTGVNGCRDRFTLTVGSLTAEWVSSTRPDGAKVTALRFVKHGTVFLDLAVYQGIGFYNDPTPIDGDAGGDWWLPEGLPFSRVDPPAMRRWIDYHSGLTTASLLDIPGNSALPWVKVCEGRGIPEGAIAIGMVFHAFSNIAWSRSDKVGLAKLRELVCREVYPGLPAEEYPVPLVETACARPPAQIHEP